MQRQWKRLSQGIGDAPTLGAERNHDMAKKQTIEAHTCRECRFSYLMREDETDPLISECTITKEREVASSPVKCWHFKPRVEDAVINPMKYLK